MFFENLPILDPLNLVGSIFYTTFAADFKKSSRLAFQSTS